MDPRVKHEDDEILIQSNQALMTTSLAVKQLTMLNLAILNRLDIFSYSIAIPVLKLLDCLFYIVIAQIIGYFQGAS